MGNETLERLNATDPAVLTDIVRQDQNNPTFEITEWNVKRLSDKGIANPDGLWLFSGWGNSGKEIYPWSVVLKILERQEEEPPADDLWHWKREYLLAQSRLTENIVVKAPRFYHSEESPDGAWIWMEEVEDHHPGKWTLDEYAFAANQLGRWNSIYLMGAPLPNANWLTRGHYRTWLSFVNPEEDWKFSLNQKYISHEVQTRYEHLWNERKTFYKALEALPQVFSHFDSQRRNLLICKNKNHQSELIALDWAQCGIGPAGAELNWLVGMSSALLEWQPADLLKLDAVAFENYMQGLQEGGWSGDVNIIRLGYVIMLAVFMGCAFPGFAAFWSSAEKREFAIQILGLAEEELFLQTLPLLYYALDCADEARTLKKKLGLS
jgi:hypothetical protein